MKRLFVAMSAAGAIALIAIITLLGSEQEAACHAGKSAAELTQAEANALYDCIQGDLIAGYTKAAAVPTVTRYREWKVVTTAPLVSRTHGGRLVNHIVNDIALERYTQWEAMKGTRFATDSIVAKEAFRVAQNGDVRPGPLFIMEKAAQGTSPATDDWIYTRVFPNGEYERTLGKDSDKLTFCHDCHAEVLEDQDAMFFPPEEYRLQF